MNEPARQAEARILARADLGVLIAHLKANGYNVIGPTVREAAIGYHAIDSADDLPIGWTEAQQGGSYRLQPREDKAVFGFTVGPNSLKSFLLPAEVSLFQARREGRGWKILHPQAAKPQRFAFFGIRPCDLRAMATQDRVLQGGPYVDAVYRARRDGAFLVAVNCGQAASTCFCTSMGSGPRADAGFDLALTELLDPGRHAFLVEAGSDAGRQVLAALPSAAASIADVQAAQACTDRAAAQIGRSLNTEGLPELLAASMEHASWDEVAHRCLSCGNCTQVCPTCFCTTATDTTDLSGDAMERTRRWDSCFSIEYSHIHGGSVRPSARARYRQWMTHKLGTWVAQFGSSGCVGCGRCITWCPVGIDLTVQARVLREAAAAQGGEHGDA